LKVRFALGNPALARVLAERLHARRVYDCEDNPFLGEFYSEKTGYPRLRVQMYFLMERQKRMREALAVESPCTVAVRFPNGEWIRIFANLNLDRRRAETLRAVLRSAGQRYSRSGPGDLSASEAGSVARANRKKSDEG